MVRVRTWDWPEINCNTCKKLENKIPKDQFLGEALKHLQFYCPEVVRVVAVEEIVDPDKMPCKGEKHEVIPNQCVSMVRWKASPHLLNSGYRMRCRRRAIRGTTVCHVHGATPPKRIEEGIRVPSGNRAKNKMEFFANEIREKIEAFKSDPDLEKVDLELAYLKSLLPRIEEGHFDDDEKKFRTILKTLDSIFKNMEARERIIEQRRYSLGLEKVQILIKLVFDAVKKHVKDPKVIQLIGIEIQNIAGRIRNINQNGTLPESKEEEYIDAEYEEIDTENKQKIVKKVAKKQKKIKKKVKK